MKKAVIRICGLLLISTTIVLLFGCQSEPEQNAVVSKNDGSFDANVAISASEHHTPDETQPIQYSDIFYSTDSTVEFRFLIDEVVTAADMPVVEVAPHMLTEEDVQQVAETLFGYSEFYELDSYVNPTYSKKQIQETLARWTQYSNDEALKNLYGDDHYDKELVQVFISDLTKKYEEAPLENQLSLTTWEFKNGSVYWHSKDELNKVDTSAYCDEIALKIPANGVQYLFSAAKRNKQTSKLNHIIVYPYSDLSPDDIDSRIFYATLCRTNKPDEQQIENVKKLAQSMLEKIGLGEWVVDQCYVDTSFYRQENECVINVNAVPAINGIATARQDQFSGLSSDKSTYAFNYYLTNAHFEFNTDGKLVKFELDSPIDIIRTINANVATMDIGDLLDRAKEHLILSDYYEYGLGPLVDAIKETEDLNCIVTINQLKYSLLRVKVPDSNDSYYYVPGLVLSGTIEYYGKDSGQLYYMYNSTDNVNKHSKTLLVLNAVDGTIIRTGND